MIDHLKETYRQKMIAQIEVWDLEISTLRDDVAMIEASARGDYLRRLNDLDRRYARLMLKYGNMLLASNGEWKETQNELNAAAASVAETLEELTSKFAQRASLPPLKPNRLESDPARLFL